MGAHAGVQQRRDVSGRSDRHIALDGLRGLAAFVVVIHHTMLISPTFAGAYRDRPVWPSGVAWWFTRTPLHLVWAGSEAVYVFFVLSGFVLVLPFLGDRPPRWPSYYPRRLIRLYLPVWASLVFAAATFVLISHHGGPRQSWWINVHDVPLTLPQLRRDAVLLLAPGWYDSPLWSLRLEVLFSLLLPLYLLVARHARKWLAVVAAVLAIAVSTVGSVMANGILIYMPMFALGVLMAVHRDVLAALAARLGRLSWLLLAAASVILVTSGWNVPGLPGVLSLGVLGAVLLVFLFLANRTAIRLGSSGLVQWLGRLSFSLYLVHEPIVVSVAFALHTTNWLLVLVIALPLALLVAMFFFLLVEGPSHRLANHVGHRIAARL